MAESHQIAVLGATGFGGALCAALAIRHPDLELTAVTARSEVGTRHDALYPRFEVRLELEQPDFDVIAEKAGSAFVAYPHGAAAPTVRALRERGLKVVDLSADFRLSRERYERWYQPHEAPELLDGAVYGLPERHREQLLRTELAAGPGCNSTAAILALAPLEERLREAVVDIKTGVSGAGREATRATHFVSVQENVNAYKTEGHRHVAELEQELADGASFTFMPHLVPIDQGLLASCYATIEPALGREAVRDLYDAAYADEPFVDVIDSAPRTADVRETNRARVQVTTAGAKVVAFCAIDNLWKGAAGQAVQALNLMLGLDEREGLE